MDFFLGGTRRNWVTAKVEKETVTPTQTHTHTQRQSYVFQYGCQLVGTRIGATLHSLVQGNPGSSIALRAIERFP